MTVQATEQVTVYWIRGCANCTRMKGYLADRGIDYVAVDVQADEDAFEKMQKAGVMSFPSVRVGERWATGFDLTKVNDLLGLDGDPTARILAIEELAERAARFLETDGRFAMQLPPDHYDDPTPTMREFKKAVMFFRDGTPYVPHYSSKNLVHHIAGHGEKFKRFALAADGEHAIGFSMAAIAGEDAAFGEPDTATPMYRVVDQMTLTAKDIRAWLRVATGVDVTREVDTHFGPQTLHQLLQTMVTSLAQHTRQLADVLERIGIAPDGRIGIEMLEGLSMASSVWGDG